jgi:microcystin-dependent protein
MPNHTHTLRAESDEPGEDNDPNGAALAKAGVYTAASNLVSMSDSALPNAGGSQPHNNMQPYLTINFIIALQGLYPSRS